MTSKKLLTIALAAAVAATSSVARAADDPKTLDVKAKIAYFDKYSKNLKDRYKYADLIQELAETQHLLAAKRIGRVLLKTNDVEKRLMCAAALSEFKKEGAGRDEAGKILLKALTQSGQDTEVMINLCDTVGDIKYKPACLDLCAIMKKGGDPWLLLQAVRAVGELGDKRALPTLLELWERNPVGYSWETGEVTYDSGAPGTHDQEMAEKKWNEKYGHVKAKGKPPVMLKIYLKEIAIAVGKITGEEIVAPFYLRKWMEARRDELAKLGIKIPRFKQGTAKQKKAEEQARRLQAEKDQEKKEKEEAEE